MTAKMKKQGFELKNITRMYKDKKQADVDMEKFTSIHGKKIGGVEFSQQVFQGSNTEIINLHVPMRLRSCMDKFEDFYKSLHKGHKIIWLHEIGTCQVRPVFTKKWYQLEMNIF